MVTEMRTTRVHRTWLDKILLWRRAYETRILDGHHEVVGRGPTPEASRDAAEQRWVAETEADATWNTRSYRGLNRHALNEETEADDLERLNLARTWIKLRAC